MIRFLQISDIHLTDVTGNDDEYRRLPKGLMFFVARVGGGLHSPLNPERLRKLTEKYISSNEKIKKALGVERTPVDARKGLQRTLESFK